MVFPPREAGPSHQRIPCRCQIRVEFDCLKVARARKIRFPWTITRKKLVLDMELFRYRNAVEQLADHLHGEILRGTLVGKMPGVGRLAAELGCCPRTVLGALKQLEQERIVMKQGAGRASRIEPRGGTGKLALRIKILLYESSDGARPFMVDLLHRFHDAGHHATNSEKSLLDLKMDPDRVLHLVQSTAADAWVVFAGSRPVLECLADRPEPVFAIAGRRHSVRIAGCGPDKVIAQKEIVKRLFALGHRRIVILAREERRQPYPARFERSFLDQLEKHGIPTGPYNLPDWHDRPGGLQQCLDSLFDVSPPTALFIEESQFFIAALQHLAKRGILAPRDVSLICGDPSPDFKWCDPPVAHIDWNSLPLIRRIVRWADNMASGKEDVRQNSIRTCFVEGGTVGPTPEASAPRWPRAPTA